MVSLKRKVSIITGAASGIGRATAVHFASLGSFVSLVDLDGDNLEKTREMCLNEGLTTDQVLTVTGDLTEANVQHLLIKGTMDHFGKLDTLINCAGIARPKQYACSATMEDFDVVMNVNLKAGWTLIQLCVPYLKESHGTIVNVSSMVSEQPIEASVPYCISKASMDQLTRCAAMELAPFQIRINSVNPGPVDTNIIRNSQVLDEKEHEALMKIWADKTLLKRLAQPVEIAKTIAFLASDESSYMTGVNLLVDGGYILGQGC